MSSLSDKAYREIKRKMVTLEMPPGERIHETALMDELQVGRTPIRDALRRLAREDLVVIIPRRGMFVSEISITDLQHIFEARAPLEIACARLAAQRASAEVIVAMETLTQQITAACESENPHALPEIDEQFHVLLARASNNKFLVDAVNWLYSLSLRLWYLKLEQMGNMRNAMQEHIAVVDALKRGDPDAAEAAVRKHLSDFQSHVRAVL